MTTCAACGNPTTNPRFCSVRCSAPYNASRIVPRAARTIECERCGTVTRNKRFCSRSCAASTNNSGVNRHGTTAQVCRYGPCGRGVRAGGVYCSRQCQGAATRAESVRRWLAGEATGLDVGGVVTPWVKAWLRETRGDRCERCGWAEVNPTTGKVPVVADHIDGDWTNNRPENLRLLCPNCDSLQPTYGGLNRGNGRSRRRSRSNPVDAPGAGAVASSI